MSANVVNNRFTVFILVAVLMLAPGLTVLGAVTAAPSEVRAAPAGLFLVDHDGDASGQPCTSGTDNDCSLRSAIEHANSGAGADSIIFESGDMTIVLGSPLPALTDDDTTIGPLDTSQVIEIDANGVNGNVFEITGDNITLAYLRMYGSGTGWANVWIHGSAQGVTIANNVIGDDTPSSGGCGNSGESHSGIFVSSTGSTPADARAWIYGNVIKCNGMLGDGEGHGIVLDGTDEVVVGDDGSGASVRDEENEIISNAGHGLLIRGEASDNEVRNNEVLRNDGSGVVLAFGASNNTIGSGSSFGARNLISGNALSGVRLVDSATTGNVIDGNSIGTDGLGEAALPNGSDGVTILGATETTVGSSSSAPEQVIANNGRAGVFIEDGDGTSIGLSTVVRHNSGAGIVVAGDAEGSDLAPRAVHSNGGLPIDLGNDGHTPNDPGDADTGPNTLLNYPQITSSAGSTITGTTCAECHVRIYEAVGDPAGAGGGGELVTVVSADAGGTWSASLSFGLTRSDVSVVARDSSRNTSEMSPRRRVFLPLTLRD